MNNVTSIHPTSCDLSDEDGPDSYPDSAPPNFGHLVIRRQTTLQLERQVATLKRNIRHEAKRLSLKAQTEELRHILSDMKVR